MIKNNLTKRILSVVAMASVIFSATITAYADTTSGTTEIVGNFNPITLNISIPATSSFTYNPNTQGMTAQTFNILNHTNAPVYMNVNQIAVSPTSTWKPNLVATTAFSDSEWTNLTRSQTISNVSLGLMGYTSDESWLYGIENQKIWSSNLSSPIEMGVIKANSGVGVEPLLKAGTSIDSESILTTNYIFEFGLK